MGAASALPRCTCSARWVRPWSGRRGFVCYTHLLRSVDAAPAARPLSGWRGVVCYAQRCI